MKPDLEGALQKKGFLLLAWMLLLTACARPAANDAVIEAVPDSCGAAIEAAPTEFNAAFAGFSDPELTETRTWTDAGAGDRIVMEFRCTSTNSDGACGIGLQQDEDVAIDKRIAQ